MGAFLDEVSLSGSGTQSQNAPSSIAGIDANSGQSNLPFRSVLNWSSLVMFEGDVDCLLKDDYEGARALGKYLKELDRKMSDDEFRVGCEYRLREYRRALSYLPPASENVPWGQDLPQSRRDTGSWGAMCTCPDGQKYPVADNNDFCGTIACDGGEAGKTCIHTEGPWTHRGVTCSPSKSSFSGEGAASALLAELYRVRAPLRVRSSAICSAPPQQPPPTPTTPTTTTPAAFLTAFPTATLAFPTATFAAATTT